MNEIVKVFNAELIGFNNEVEKELDPKEVRDLNGIKYLPIQRVEDKLRYYFGLFQTRNFTFQPIINEICGSLELGVYHPVLKEWIWLVGTGAIQIQLRSEKNEKGERVPTDLSDPNILGKKILNTLQKDLPHMKAECIKNAAKGLGRQFGSGLNRKLEDGEDVANVMTMDEIDQVLSAVTRIEDLNEAYRQLTDIQKKDKRIQKLFKIKKIDLQQDGNA